MKKNSKIVFFLIICMCFCFGISDVQTGRLWYFENALQMSKVNAAKKNKATSASKEQTVKKWANAYCSRDGETLYQLFDPDNKDAFYQIEHVNSQKGDSEITFGDSSPWPWETNFEISIKENEAKVVYYAMTSDPHIYTWIETLNLVKKNNIYYVTSESIKEYDLVTTKEELKESINGNYNRNANKLNYKKAGLAETLNQNAKKSTATPYKELFSPETAAPYLLNLSGGKSSVKETLKKKVEIIYTFPNGESVEIKMTQPFGETGIWLVENIAF